nr:unnamed protein product [Callosobruchus chinensis]
MHPRNFFFSPQGGRSSNVSLLFSALSLRVVGSTTFGDRPCADQVDPFVVATLFTGLKSH